MLLGVDTGNLRGDGAYFLSDLIGQGFGTVHGAHVFPFSLRIFLCGPSFIAHFQPTALATVRSCCISVGKGKHGRVNPLM